MTKTKVKVDKDKLIEAIEARRAEAEKEHNKAKAAAAKAETTYTKKAVAAVEKALRAAEEGLFITTSTWDKGPNFYVLRLPATPGRVSDEFDGSRFDRDIRLLEMSPDTTISLSTEDFERYVR